MLKDTELHAWDAFSSWEGKLALVTTTGYYGSYLAANEEEFNPRTLARRYIVRYALDLNKQPLCAKVNERFVGFRPKIANPSIPYEQTTFEIERLHGCKLYGTFAAAEIVWVKLKFKDLAPSEMRALEAHLKDLEYVDISNVKYKAKKSDWAKMLKMTFAEAQELHYELANAADDLVTKILGRYADNAEEEKRVWEDIKGIYKMTKDGTRVLFILPVSLT